MQFYICNRYKRHYVKLLLPEWFERYLCIYEIQGSYDDLAVQI